MSKSIIMSIQPDWIAKILNGEKTIEIRKTMPKCDLPIDVYLYCSKGKPYLVDFGDNEYPYKSGGYVATSDLYNIKRHEVDILNGKVVAKFTLNNIDECKHYGNGYDFSKFIYSKTNDIVFEDFIQTSFELKSCLEYEDIVAYARNKMYGDLSKINNFYAWHIDNLVIFDKPKELWEFYKSRFEPNKITDAYEKTFNDLSKYRVTKAPQSWQYVYVKGE